MSFSLSSPAEIFQAQLFSTRFRNKTFLKYFINTPNGDKVDIKREKKEKVKQE